MNGRTVEKFCFIKRNKTSSENFVTIELFLKQLIYSDKLAR